LRKRQIELGPWLDRRSARSDVAGDADDDLQRVRAGRAAGEPLANRILAGKQERGEPLADDRHELPAGAIAVVEVPSLDDRHTHRVEEAGVVTRSTL
jgi:hypothetical protein